MNLNLTGKRVFVSASSRGIGAAIAERFEQEGAIVVRNSRNGKDSDFFISGDMTKEQDIKRIADKIGSRFGGIDILVCNLGSGKSASSNKWETSEWSRLFDINLFSTVSLINCFLPLFGKNGGAILVISSLAGICRVPAPPAYSAAKNSLRNLVVYGAKEFALKKIRINGIAPGNVYFEGGRWAELLSLDEEATIRYIKEYVPMQRFATPEEIADSAVFLCSDKSSFTTGAILSIDGGQNEAI